MPVIIASFLGQPLPVAGFWPWMVFPMCLTISLVYKTTKTERFAQILPATAILFISMIGGLALVTIALWRLIQL